MAIGTIQIVNGTVTINGVQARAGDTVDLNSTIQTGHDGSIVIDLDNGNRFDLGRNSIGVIDSDVVPGVVNVEEAILDVETLQAALSEGNFDALNELEATAAGGDQEESDSEDSVNDPVVITRTGEVGLVTAGFDTSISENLEFPETIDDLGVVNIDDVPGDDPGDIIIDLPVVDEPPVDTGTGEIVPEEPPVDVPVDDPEDVIPPVVEENEPETPDEPDVPEDPETPDDPEEPEQPEVEDDPEDPVDEPEDDDPEDPVDDEPEDDDPEDEDPDDDDDEDDPDEPDDDDEEEDDPEVDDDKGQNNGWGNGDQDAPGNSGDNNQAENSDNDVPPGIAKKDIFPDDEDELDDILPGNSGQNNGFGNGDQDAPGNSENNNGAENKGGNGNGLDNAPGQSAKDFVPDIDDTPII